MDSLHADAMHIVAVFFLFINAWADTYQEQIISNSGYTIYIVGDNWYEVCLVG
jgi:hypothetical protein